jgi:hypothetical protein
MGQNRFRRIAHLEKLAKPNIDVGRQTALKWAMTLQGAVGNAAILAFVIRHGRPNIGEPLSYACQRVSESEAYRECREKSRLRRFRAGRFFEPHERGNASIIGMYLRYALITTFPGTDEREKLNAVFASAPPWLIWFAFADYTAGLLGLTLPDLSSVTGFARSQANFDLWYGVPSDAFEPRPWANGPENEPLAYTDLTLVRPVTQRPERQMTRREQKRARQTYLRYATKRTADWPPLYSTELFEMRLDDAMELVARQPEAAFAKNWVSSISLPSE